MPRCTRPLLFLYCQLENDVVFWRNRRVQVVLKFASEEAALNWYNDPDYAPVKKIRLDSTANTVACLTKEFVLPTA